MQLKKFTRKDRHGNMMSFEFDVPQANVPAMQSIPMYDHPGDPKGTDTVPAWLTPGEFVVNKEATDIYGPVIKQMNDVGREIQDMKPEYAAEGKEVLDNQRKIYKHLKNKDLSENDKELLKKTKKITDNLNTLIDNQNLNSYIKSVISISFLTNKYINDAEPWKLKKTNISKMNNILHLSLEQIGKISILLNPIIPMATSKVLNALNISKDKRNLSFIKGSYILPDEVNINDLNILFKKISS